jgi:hypothetical protein
MHIALVAALALIDHDAEAREALQRYLAPPSTGPLKTIAALKAYSAQTSARGFFRAPSSSPPTSSRELPRLFPQKGAGFFRGSLTGAPSSSTSSRSSRLGEAII